MNLDHLSAKQLNEIEHLLRDLQVVMRKANLHNEPLAKSLQAFESEVGEERRARFDAANPEYTGY